MNKITIDDIKITIKKVKNSSNTLARATVAISDQVEIHGFTISKSKEIHNKFQEKIWIQPPRTGRPYWVNIVFISDRELWEQVEESIYNKFHMLNLQVENEVNLDDIPDDLGTI